MKGKISKVLAGVGMAVVGATMLTACSSDITFNQEDLDRALKNVNEYIEEQRENNSDYVRNNLLSCISKAYRKSFEQNKFGYVAYAQDVCKDKVKYNDFKRIDGDTSKLYLAVYEDDNISGEYYQEIGQTNIIYDNFGGKKTKKTVEGDGTISQTFGSIQNLVYYVYEIVDPNEAEDTVTDFDFRREFTMEYVSDGSIKFNMISANYSSENTSGLLNNFEIVFKNDCIMEFSMYHSRLSEFDANSGKANTESDKVIYEFSYTFDDFTFDTTGYVEES